MSAEPVDQNGGAATDRTTAQAGSFQGQEFKNITKKLCRQIGFGDDEFDAAMFEAEQACGAHFDQSDTALTSEIKTQLHSLADQHVVPTWKHAVKGLDKESQRRFWSSFMSKALRNYKAKLGTGDWVQKKRYATATQSSGLPLGQPPTTTSLFAVPSGAYKTPVQHERALSPTQSMQSLTLKESSSSPVVGRNRRPIRDAMTWRQVRLHVSFTGVEVADPHHKMRALKVPLARCAKPECHPIDEDSVVNASWLDFRCLETLIVEHCVGSDIGGINRDYIACVVLGRQVMAKVRDSNEFHGAYNDFVRQNNEHTGLQHSIDWRLMLIPVGDDLLNMSESDISDTDNPFVLRGLPVIDPSDTSLKRRRTDDDHREEVDNDDDRTPRPSEHRALKKPRTDTLVEPEEANIAPAPQDACEKSDVGDSEDRPACLDGNKDGDVVMGGHAPVGVTEEDTLLAEEQMGDEFTVQVLDEEDHGAVGRGQTYDKKAARDANDVYRPGDEEYCRVWNDSAVAEDDIDSDRDADTIDAHAPADFCTLIRRSRVRPDRFDDDKWLVEAGFKELVAKLPKDAGHVIDEDNADDDVEGAPDEATSSLDAIAQQVFKSRAMEQFHPEMWSTVAKYLMCDESTRFKTDYPFVIPGANPEHVRTPGQLFGGVWMKLNENKVMGGIMSDQVGSGKTRTTLASLVADRAYINRMWNDWVDDKRRAKKDKGYVRRHLPAWRKQDGTERCPSAAKWVCQCVCEKNGVTASLEEQRGPTLVFVPTQALKSWIDEYIKLFADSPSDRYVNKGFGKRHGFGYDDNKPFRLIIGHDETRRLYRNKGSFEIEPDDQDDMLPEGDYTNPEVLMRPKLFTDRLVILTTLESYEAHVQSPLKLTIQPLPSSSKRAAMPAPQSYPLLLRYGAVVFDEAHTRSTVPDQIAFLTRDIQTETETHAVVPPRLWLVSGTPFTHDVFSEIGSRWGPLWEQLCKQAGHMPWSHEHSWMAGFDQASIKARVSKKARLMKDGGDDARRSYVLNAVKFASRLIIQRTESTRLQGQPVVVLPPVTKYSFTTPLSESQKQLANEPWEMVKQQAQAIWRVSVRRWKKNGAKGPEPKLDQYLKRGVQNLPLVRASTSFPQLSKVASDYQTRLWAQYDEQDPVMVKSGRAWSQLTDEEKYGASSLRLTIKEINDHGWDKEQQETTGPYYEFREAIMDNSHKKGFMDKWWDLVAGSKNAAGEWDKGILFTCSPASALVAYHYFKYGCNNEASKYYRNRRAMNVLLITSTNMPLADKALWLSIFNGDLVARDKFDNRPVPDIIIATTGTFGQGQNCGRARYSLILEPQPSLKLYLQVLGRIRRAGYTEPVQAWEAVCPNSDWEKVQKARNEDHAALLRMIQEFERDAEAQPDSGKMPEQE